MTSFEKELEEKGFIAFTNKGTSMMPLLRHDKDVMIIRAKRSGFEKGDAVLFIRADGKYILHRITEVCGEGKYIITGDNCISGEAVYENQIIGILTDIKKNGKTISIDSKEYKRYLRLLPIRRAILPLRFIIRRILSFGKRCIKKILSPLLKK